MPPEDHIHVRVIRYSFDELSATIARCYSRPGSPLDEAAFRDHLEYVKSKDHLEYFRTYFENADTRAGTIVVEEPYTDRDFLEDYAAFYVRCLDKYKSRCCRLHFFKNRFSQTDLDALLCGMPTADLPQNEFVSNYLGFVVVRPLPQTFIGRTCLRTYPGYEKGTSRHFPVTRNYEVNLAGISLKVRSLAFQEQDCAASACATSSLWSAFNATAKLFDHNMYSPVQITRYATEYVPGAGRALPNNGLTVHQIAGAITAVGMEAEVLTVSERAEDLQMLAYAYLNARIPVLMGASLYDATNPTSVEPYNCDRHALHAVTITGFSLGKAACTPHPKYDTLLTSSRIDKLYVHDDQVGPFARVKFAEGLSMASGEVASQFSLTTSWKDRHNTPGNVRFAPVFVVVPLYHKIRLPYRAVLSNVIIQDRWRFEPLRQKRPDLLSSRLEWNIRLAWGSDLKRQIRENSPELTGEYRWELLQDQLPRFVWAASASTSDGKRVVDLLYDATDVETADYFLAPIWYNEKVKDALA